MQNTTMIFTIGHASDNETILTEFIRKICYYLKKDDILTEAKTVVKNLEKK